MYLPYWGHEKTSNCFVKRYSIGIVYFPEAVMKYFLVLILFVCINLFAAQIASASVIDFVTGISSATLIEDGQYAGLYRYDMSISWRAHLGISSISLLLGDNFTQRGHTFIFSSPAGTSLIGLNKGTPFTMNWTGVYVPNEGGSLFDGADYVQFTGPFHHHRRTGRIGMGNFSFYSDITPQYSLNQDVIILNHRRNSQIDGDLSGALPHHSTNPEPASLGILFFGSLILIARKRHN